MPQAARSRRWPIAATALALLLASVCAGPSEDAETLVAWMTGSFSSRAQAERDSTYFHITLEMAPIWTDVWTDTEAWLYIEQAAASALDRPYRQRVYRLEKVGRGYVSYVYTIADAATLAGMTDTDA